RSEQRAIALDVLGGLVEVSGRQTHVAQQWQRPRLQQGVAPIARDLEALQQQRLGASGISQFQVYVAEHERAGSDGRAIAALAIERRHPLEVLACSVRFA